MTDTTTPQGRRELKAKSLGEKMFDALHYDSRSKSAVWSSVPDRSRDYYEIAGMAFAASLTHDETANAVISALTASAEASEQMADRLRQSLTEVRGWIALDALDAERTGDDDRKDAADLMLRGIDADLATTKSGEA